MRYARGPGPDMQLIEAERGRTGTCPGCGSALVAKCGPHIAHHWAHHARPDCDSWSEPESEWHLAWKRHAPPERTEVVMGANREHRADVVLPNGYVLELQHSALSAEAIREREEFYTREAGGMCWLWDARRFWKAAKMYLDGSGSTAKYRELPDPPRLALTRHRTLLLPRCAMFWDVPPHPSFSAPGVADHWRDCEKRLSQEIDRVSAALVSDPESLLRDAVTAYEVAVAQHEAVARSGNYKLDMRELHARIAVLAAKERVAKLRAAPTAMLAAQQRLQGLSADLNEAETAIRHHAVWGQLSAGTIAYVVPQSNGAFHIEQLIPRDQFASVIRGAQ